VRIAEDELVALLDGVPLPERGEKKKPRLH
jgi:hypothetical protein